MGNKRKTDGIKGAREPDNVAKLVRKVPKPIHLTKGGAYKGRLHKPSCRRIQTLASHKDRRAIKCNCQAVKRK